MVDLHFFLTLIFLPDKISSTKFYINVSIVFIVENNLSYLIAIMINESSAFQTARVINIDTVQRIYSETNILSKTMPVVSVGETLMGVSWNRGYDVICFIIDYSVCELFKSANDLKFVKVHSSRIS